MKTRAMNPSIKNRNYFIIMKSISILFYFYKFFSPSSVTSDWTVNAQTFDYLEDWPSDIGAYTASEVVSWGAFSPDPVFDSSTEPR